jgi:predicted RNA-binding protein YlxR (DUF448 family)
MIELDVDNKKEGRAAYLCYDLSCAERARKSRSFERHLKAKAPEDFEDTIKRYLRGRD